MQEPLGVLRGIALRAVRRAPMQPIDVGVLDPAFGLEGDCKGGKYPLRQVTVLSAEDWQKALEALGGIALDWTARRANLLVSGLRLPRARGALLGIGPARLEVTGQTYPCGRMEEAWPGLLKALAPDWRGGLTCRVLAGGRIGIGDAVEVLCRPPDERPPRLP